MNTGDALPRSRILIADDKIEFARDTELLLGDEYETRICQTPEEAIEIHNEGWPDLVLLDLDFSEAAASTDKEECAGMEAGSLSEESPETRGSSASGRVCGMDGIAALEKMRAHDTSIPIIMLTVHQDPGVVVEAMRRGAYHFVGKAQGPGILLETISAALRHNEIERNRQYLDSRLKESRGGGALVLGPSPTSQRLLEEIREAAGADVTVLITGETGTGKELVAREIHNLSGRALRPFVPVDVGSLPETLVESALFGHEKGAFTGAVGRQIGAFEAASGGSIFLDEVGEMPLQIQARLLRILQERSFRRVGGFDRPEIKADVRVLAATNQDLEEMVAAGDFRRDLYYRLYVMRIHVPPLRDRIDDIPVLARHFIDKHHVVTGSKVRSISEEGIAVLEGRPWQGNIRELEHDMVARMVRAKGPTLCTTGDAGTLHNDTSTETNLPYAAAKDQAMEEFKRDYIRGMLANANGVVNEAARRAGLAPSSLRKMMRELGIKGQR